MNIVMNNIDEKVMQMFDRNFSNDEAILMLAFLDKDKFKLAELNIYKDSFLILLIQKGNMP